MGYGDVPQPSGRLYWTQLFLGAFGLMNIRPKTIHRLLILFGAFAIFAGGVGAMLYRSYQRQKADVAGLRAAAFQAFQLKDYSAAVSLFHDYVARSHTDAPEADVLFEYGTARVEVPEEGNRQVTEAIDLLQRYLNTAADDPRDASHELLKLYVRARYNRDALNLAGKLLAKDPRDTEALRARAQSLIGEHSTTEALAACVRLDEIDPLNLLWQKRELLLMAENKRPTSEIVARARQLLDTHRQDPRFNALMSYAYGLAGDNPNAKKLLEIAAKLPPADAETDLQILASLDDAQQIGLFDFLLARAAAADPDPRLQRLLLQRLFEQQRYAELADKLKDVDAKSPQVNLLLLGYRVIALNETQHKAEADAIVKTLSERTDQASLAWAEALRAQYAAQVPEPGLSVKAYFDAVEHDKSNPVFHFFLGDAHGTLGETDEAVREWALAARLSPTWATPLFRISHTLSAAGRFPEALRAALLLRRRAPELLVGRVEFAIADWGYIEPNAALVSGPEGENLLKFIEQIRTAAPNETDTLPAYIALLSQRGQRDKAIEVEKAALASVPPLSERMFGQLADVSAQEHLGLEQDIIERAEAVHGNTPGVAFSRAYSLYKSGKHVEALQFVDLLRKSHPNDPAWQLDEAHFRDVVGDADAVKTWIAICDAYPDDVRVQYRALSTPSRFADRKFWQRTIDRVKALTGPNAQAWQIEQARYHVAGTSSPQEFEADIAALQKIVQTSPELVDAHRLLAQAMIRTQKQEYLAKATAELTTAHDLQPDDFQSTVELAPLLASQGMLDKALLLVDSVAAAPGLQMDRRLWAAQMYADLGKVDSAIKLLTADEATQTDSNRDGLLAQLYIHAGRMEDAAALYKKILANVNAGPDALGAGANFFASSKQPELASLFVERLKKMPMAPGTAELLQAHLYEVEGQLKSALESLQEVAKARPQSERAWLELSGFYLRFGRLDDADKAAAQGLTSIPASVDLATMRLEIEHIRSLNTRDIYPLVNVLSRTPRQPIAEEAIAALAAAKSHNDSPPKVLATLRQLADQHPRFLPLQEVVVRRYLAASRFDDAAALASRICEVAPYDVQSLQLLTTVEIASKNWDGARAAGERWRQASGLDTLDPDINIALTYLEQPSPDPQAAMKQLDLYMTDGAPTAQKEAATPAYCRALLMSGHINDAAIRLLPLVATSPKWAEVWFELATLGAQDGDAATNWLKRVDSSIGTDATALRVGLAGAWEQAGQKFDLPSAHETALAQLKPIVTKSPVPAAAWWQWALVNQSMGNLPDAQRGWEEYLKLNPREPHGLNNLAYILFLDGNPEQMSRAEGLATEAIAAYPEASTFYDTLGRIEFRLGKTADAIKTFRTAVEKDPSDLDAMIGLADSLQSQPSSREEVRALLTRINAMVDGGMSLSPPIRKQLERVKSAMTSSL